MKRQIKSLLLLILLSTISSGAAPNSKAPRGLYVDDAPEPMPTREDIDRGCIIFSRNYLRLIFDQTKPAPDERIREISLSACPGEYEPAVIALYSLDDLKGIRITTGTLTGSRGSIKADNISVRPVSFLLKQGQGRWGKFNDLNLTVPLILEEQEDFNIAPKKTLPFWLTVRVPEHTAAGSYTTTIKIAATGKQAAELQLKVNVRPFKLDIPYGVCFGMYAKMRTDPDFIAESFADMREHGMTSIGLCGNADLSMEVKDKAVSIEFNGQSTLEKNMEAYKHAGFTEPVVWLMGGDIARFCEKISAVETDEFSRLYRQSIVKINEHSRKLGWPEIVYQPIDEPFEHVSTLPRAMRLLEILKSIPGLRTENDGMNGRWENFTDECYKLTDILALHDGPTLHRGQLDMDEWNTYFKRITSEGRRVWFYNIDLTAWHPEPMRYMYGFGLFKSNCHGVIQWAYMWPVRDDPEIPYNQPDAILFRFPGTTQRSGGPTIGYEAIREGIDDYRYILTLHNLVAQAKGSGNTALAVLAENLWTPIQQKIDQASFENCKGRAMQGNWTGNCDVLEDKTHIVRGDHKIDNNWSFEDYHKLRETISESICRLRSARSDRKPELP